MCNTNFFDLIEIINTNNHPVGRKNYVSSDYLILNLLLSVICIISFIIALVDLNHLSPLFYAIAALFYLVQIMEACITSETIKTLWNKNKWIEF